MLRRNDTEDAAALDALCALYGIASAYTDVSGALRQVTAQTQRALLAAQGVHWDADSDPMDLLDQERARLWQAWLEPVMVVRAGAVLRIPIALPVTRMPRRLQWRLILETGQQQGGTLEPADLPVIERGDCSAGAFVRYAFTIAKPPSPGYHRFELRRADADANSAAEGAMTVIVAPPRCYRPVAISEGRRSWGLAVQTFALRSTRNWGIGDFTDLQAAVEHAAQCGAGMVGVSPLHALFPARPAHASPYSPSSRSFLNVLYLDVEAIDDFKECQEAQAAVQDAQFQAHLRALRSRELVDYPDVAATKLAVLERLHAHFRRNHLHSGSERAKAFQRFCADHGGALRDQTRFDALQAHFQQTDPKLSAWTDWPAGYRSPDGEAVAAFASRHAERVEFFAYLYWQAELQLANVGQRCLERHLGVGLYLDLALGSDGAGADVWAHQDLFARRASVGAPPDAFSPDGQDWGLPPLLPQRLRATAYRYFIALLRRNMRHAGALRIDHVMGLQRQFWVPTGASPAEGGYVAYPLHDLLGIVALESQRNRCLIVGEDLGTVPDGLRDTLDQAGVLSYRVLYFAKDSSGAFLAPDAYPRQALVTVSTHDLPTLAGFWSGHDLDLRSSLRLFADERSRQEQIVQRVEDRARLLMALESTGLLPADVSVYPGANTELTPELTRAIHLYLARAPAALLALRPEDIFNQLAQTNLPGSADAQPNWQAKLPLNLEEWLADARFDQVVQALNQERGERPAPAPQASAPPPRLAASIPRATYRLQFNRDFTFAEATALVPYLAQLGVSHCYASPLLKARPGSMHGYDIIDHLSLNPEIGTNQEFEALVDALHAHDMGLLMDIVPNHMAVMGSDNAWWLDVLENGQASTYADFFDIDWDTYQYAGGHKVLLPVLGDHYAKVLDSGELRLGFNVDSGEFSISYYEHRFPVDPREYPRIIGQGLDRLSARLAADDPRALEFQSLVTAFGHLPGRDATAAEQIAERSRDKEIHKRHLAKLYARSADVAQFIDENITAINRESGDTGSADRLHELIGAQAYRLAYWRVASDEINYRRFFDINDLAALRMENPNVFATTHALIFELLDQGKIDGLRIDHPDGLYDPLEYFNRLQSRYANPPDAEATGRSEAKPIYIVVEKILAEHENLPESWPVHGTTGYEFANLVNGLFVDSNAEGKLQRIYGAFVGARLDFDEIVYHSKLVIMRGALASELNVLANQLSRIAQADRYTCDYTLNSLRRALVELVACFPVYRSYVDGAGATSADRRYIDWAVKVAKKRSQAADVSIFDFLHDVLNTRIGEGKNQLYRDAVTALARKFQQYTAPVMAKGLEDTSFYIYNRLVSLNEVGGDPRRFGISVQAFHHANRVRAQHWPHSLLATSTHDTKRSEDVRARINVVSELPDEWRRGLARWHRLNQRKKRLVDDREVPSPNEEYFFYQTLLGAWPWAEDAEDLTTLAARLEAYMQKALREAKVHSSWINPNTEYETAAAHFVHAVLAPHNSKFLSEFCAFQRRVAWFGMFNSLAQLILKYTLPGVPDIYQGNELWDFSLVDPDNRRPVDYARRRTLRATVAALDAVPRERLNDRLAALFSQPQDGAIKLFLTGRTLTWRRELAAVFRDGEYLPLECRGARAAHLCAFARRYQEHIVLVCVPRLVCTLLRGEPVLPVGAAVWGDTVIELPLPAARWENAYTYSELQATPADTGSVVSVAELFAELPFALLRPCAAP